MDQSTIYPNLNWHLFAMCNDNATDAFEDMCRDLFYCEYLHESINPHSDHNNPGVEVLPVLEPVRDDGKPQKRISFQAKYFEQNISNTKINESLKQAVKHYNGQLDLIYLFCNKTISQNTERYRMFQAILAEANIELKLVTDKDIFTLIRKHKRIADYYFQDRKRTAAGATNLMGNTSIASSVSDVTSECKQEPVNPLLQELLNDRIRNCKDAVLDLNFGKLKAELESLKSAESVDNRIRFYQIILAAHDGTDFAALIKDTPEDLKEEAYWLNNFCKNPRTITWEEIKAFSSESIITTLVVLFSEQYWENITNFISCRELVPTEALKAFDFHCALALFNLREEDKADDILTALFNKYHEPRFELYSICARLNKANQSYIYGKADQEQLIKELLAELDRAKTQSPDQLKGNGNLIATIELQSCFNLGITEKKYIDEAVLRYDGYVEETKNFDGVRFFMALCHEMGGNLEKSIGLLSSCEWREQEGVAARYLTALIDLKRHEDAIKAFDEIDVKTPRVECVYLLALARAKDDSYEVKLQEAVDNHKDSLYDLFLYGFYIEDRKIFKKIMTPVLNALVPDALEKTESQIKIGLLATLAHNGETGLIEKILNTVQEPSSINSFVAHDIYRCLYEISNRKNKSKNRNQKNDDEIRQIENIATFFYDADILKVDFLQIKLICASACDMEFSMLKYSKELFEYTHDVQIARNIIALLYKRNETKKEEYEPYIAPLKESDNPRISMAASSALWRLGKLDEADFYAYKALYNLDGKDDIEVYKSLFGYHNVTMQRLKETPARKSVTGNMVVTLQSDQDTWVVALDSEADFGNPQNRSLDAEHIGKQDPIYNKLIGSGINQVLKIRNKSYKVTYFEPREFTIGRFIFKKVTETPDRFNVHTISTKDPEEMVKQVLALSDNREHIKKLVDSYNFKDNQLGMPIDFFTYGNYEKYIASMQYLLYTKDLVYYAGEPRLEFLDKSKYIPTLSTFVLLSLHDWLDTLDWLGDSIIIPKSYMEFFEEQYAVELGRQSASEGSLVPLDDGKIAFVENDKRLPEIWEKIISKCEKYPKAKITDDERIEFEVIKGYTWERVFGQISMDKMQLDGFILSKRENGIYLCDDLFFRKIAATNQIRNINFATLLYANDDWNETMPIIMQLSKSNYLYTPIRFENPEEWQQLVENLLDGELKNRYYSDVFNAYLYAWDQFMKENFGDNWRYEIGSDDEE